MTKKKYAKLQAQWKVTRSAAYSFQQAHPEACLSANREKADPKIVRKCDRLWRRYHKIDKQLYRYEQKCWLKEWRRTFVEPYGMFATLPVIVNMLVQRFAEYWQHGYNVHIVDEDNKIAASSTEAARLGREAIQAANSFFEDDPITFEEYQKRLLTFFQYVAQHCWDWGD